MSTPTDTQPEHRDTSAPTMSGTRMIRLVAERELVDRMTNKSFVVGTLIMAVALVAVVVLPSIFGGDDDGSSIGVVGATPAGFEEVVTGIATSQDTELELVEVTDREAGEAAVSDGELDALLLVDRGEIVADGSPPMQLVLALEAGFQQSAVMEQLEAAGISGEELASLLGGSQRLTVVDVDGEAADDQRDATAFPFAMAVTVMLFIIVQINAQSLMTVALEEKSSRVIELLVSTARPWHLLTGKVLAMTALAIGQFALLVGAGLGANAAVGAFEIPTAAGGLVAASVLMLLVGFLFYATLFTVAGSMATSIEDTQSTATPLIFGLIGAYLLVIIVVIPSPAGTIANVLTFLPPTAPFVVPARMAFGELPLWQLATSAVITAAAAYGAVRLAGRLYASVLLAGNKLSWRAAWKAEPVR